ncbi:hypothetical protein Cni_G16508 [Canna indica]|uniref:Uncharacterized protein n=1 Tax=Canna indica TaxID=4628 RepID=A0AAQ3KHU3_9LILI|nr:hypothetical protein Cni_G16508 [Canna indica]
MRKTSFAMITSPAKGAKNQLESVMKREKEDGLDTVLEVPIPKEMFENVHETGLQNINSWIKAQAFARTHVDAPAQLPNGNTELQSLLNVVGSPLIPCPVPTDRAFSRSVHDTSIQASTAKYIIQQYIAATGGQSTLTSIGNMYAIGKVRMTGTEFHIGDQSTSAKGSGVIGGYALWQKSPEVWYFELIMAGSKMSAGSDGKVAWKQSMTEQSHVSKGPPRPLRRTIQGLDPRSIANLFADAFCIGEKIINDEQCFVLKLEANASVLKARSSTTLDIIHHKIWGYFSQRTGLLLNLEDTHLLRMKAGRRGEGTFWETTMESIIDDYRFVNGINIAHAGKTQATLSRYGEGSVNHKRKMEETWTIEEIDFNIWGLSMDYFLPPADLKKDQDGADNNEG